MYKLKITKKYITITPRPLEDVRDGLTIEFDRGTSMFLPCATTNIIKGRMRYSKPNDVRKIVRVYLTNEERSTT